METTSHLQETTSRLQGTLSYIVDQMTDNTSFATPTPSLKDVTDTYNEYISALGKVEYGSKPIR